ncbi:MAG: ion channel [Tissierellales bacterium]|jgi:uncharacterized protein YjbI with pentapeptide repeats|nr:ion channel [Tissierellales bacterium]
MKKKYYKQMDKRIDGEIKKARADRIKFFNIQEERLKSSKEEYKDSLSFEKRCENNLSYEKKYSEFKHNSYNFVLFKDTKWGKTAAMSEEHYIEVREKSFFYVDFTNCEFTNIIFNGCHFIGCRFEKCTTNSGKVIFQNCCLRDHEMEYNGTTHQNTQISTEFCNCSMLQIDIRNSLADGLIFDSCTIMLSTMKENEMPNIIFNNCGFYGLTIEDCKLNGAQIKGTTNYELIFLKSILDGEVDTDVYISKLSLKGYRKRIKDEYKRQMESSSLDLMKENEFIRDKYSEVAKLFYTISAVLKISNFNDDYSREYSYMHNKYLMMTKRDFWDKSVLFLGWILFGFGERMSRFVFWASGYVLIFTIIYMFTGIKNSSGEVIKYVLEGGTPVPVSEIINDFFECMHFSIITFSTVGYGNITPYGWSLLVSAVQIISGVALVALFTSVIVKKFLR